ncbi:hypothetical protein K438DRAFT_1811206 [Mycena galopus ATCC 62051]|nr:hypothetical protein K438DRAFT_1811206 [Mycena galopus ATCC 62051]
MTAMPAPSRPGLPVDDDIVDRIMTFCPTFSTLRSTILVSKAFYRVFQTRPNSITRAVAYNIVGPALPQALRVLKYPYDKYAALDSNPAEMAAACPEEHDPVIAAEDEEALSQNSQVIAELEDIYSLMNKDRTSKKSVLTWEESGRFHRAMYRIMLYCGQFSGSGYSEEDAFLEDEDILDNIRKQRTAVLNEYATDELQQLNSVVKFLRTILLSMSTVDNFLDCLLSTGPASALEVWHSRSLEVILDDTIFGIFDEDEDVPILIGYFSIPLENIWAARKITAPKEDEPESKWILDQVNGANDTCSQCGAPGGVKLYTEANWDRFPVELSNLLKNNLKQNQTVLRPFRLATMKLVDSDALGPFIDNLFALKTHTTPLFDDWHKTDSYCLGCLSRFLEEHLWIWFLEERVKGGWTPPENCWYGWNCRTQRHKPSHADTKNHLCVPIKGDAV